tara:strand:+ start:1210 stop:2187 length:978 start_codon:yes stop_codon:yes gene_type:complete
VTLKPESIPPDNMERRDYALVAILGIILMIIPTTIAEPTPVPSADYSQGMFGGVSIDISNSTNISAEENMASMPTIVEVFTATWCENCVDSEEGLMLAIEETGEETVVLTYHRAIAEVEDPFGVVEVENRWSERYGNASLNAVGVKSAPPSTVINGELLHAGSGALDSQALKPIFTGSLTTPAHFSNNLATSSISWSSNDMSNGTITWNLDAGDWLPSSTNSLIFVVESSATFEEGSNGLGDYHDVVRDMIELDGNSGSLSYTLPTAWDGDDLSLVLIHEWEIEIIIEPPTADSRDGLFGLPSIGMLWAVMGLVGAAMLSSRRDR